VITAGGDTLLQLPTHADLAESSRLPGPSASAGLDAIIVPAARSADNLQTAVDLARAIDTRLIVLCSLSTEANDARALLAENRVTNATVVPMPGKPNKWPLNDLETTGWAQDVPGKTVCGGRDSDLSMKRNAGLLLARMLHWESIFFLDDDIRDITADDLRGTVALLGKDSGPRTAGMSVKSYPDNSVVCHARREVGEFQDVFVSGSVLAVNCREPFDFFPDIYNEDWLFMYRDAAAKRLVTSGSPATQLEYNPFADPRRAAHQEFGDVIAEGLYALLHSDRAAEAADEEYWERFLADRNRVLADVTGRLGLTDLTPADQAAIRESISAARQVLLTIKPLMCTGYLTAWRHDLVKWEEVLASLPTASLVEEALGNIGLASAGR
jgi:hypothetical protein